MHLKPILTCFIIFATYANLNGQYNEIFKNVHERRIIIEETDSLILHPFEMFAKMRFDSIDYFAMNGPILLFTILENNEVFSLQEGRGDTLTDLTKRDKNGDKISNYRIQLNLLSSGIREIKRELIGGNLYKVIFSYECKSPARRPGPWEGEDGSYYYIVDIAPYGSKFERQLPASFE